MSAADWFEPDYDLPPRRTASQVRPYRKMERWHTSDGRIMNISDMHPDHVANSLAMILRHLRAGYTVRLANGTGKILFVKKPTYEPS